MKNLILTTEQIHLDSLKRNFTFENTYSTSSTKIYVWVNFGKNGAIIGYQQNHNGYISFVTIEEANNLLNNI